MSCIESCSGPAHKARVLQFGTGVFLRGFFDWMLQQARDASKWQGFAIGVKLTSEGTLALAKASSHTHTTRGVLDGRNIEKHTALSVVEKWLNPYEAEGLEEFLASARLPSLDVVVSNSTEAGLAYERTERPAAGICPKSFPAKLTMWLHARFEADSRLHVTLLPLELLEDNGELLQDIVKRHADDWKLGSDFNDWLERNCDFRCTLVDRIVTKPSAQDDPLLTISEPYHLLAIDGDSSLEDRLPLKASGANVIYTSKLLQYRIRKVRVLNGAHHIMTFLGLSLGKRNVLECINDPALGPFIRDTILNEVLPILPGDAQELRSYAAAIFERFANPWLDHRLEAIAMNSSAKVLVRLIPSISDYLQHFQQLPSRLVLALAAFLAYTGPIKGCEKEPVTDACKSITGLAESVAAAIAKLAEGSIFEAMPSTLTVPDADVTAGSDAKRPRIEVEPLSWQSTVTKEPSTGN
mmetsp:Transcript_36727/g.63824  ORF Transcript_36727/g.63824 Transcript_36727/m.63824 type:complete len:467 (+) Transcript_36727:78-1478(+)